MLTKKRGRPFGIKSDHCRAARPSLALFIDVLREIRGQEHLYGQQSWPDAVAERKQKQFRRARP